MNIKEQAHKYLADKGCLSIGQTYTAFQVKIMLTEFAQEQVKLFRQHDVSVSVCDSEWHESNIMHYGECTACGLNVDDV